jgi:flagellar assembly protein FliH
VTAGAAFTLAEAVVGRELALAVNPGRDAVARALALSPDGVELTLRLNPDDAAVLDADSLPAGRAVTVIADATLAAGDCVADAGWSHIDARIGTALDRVRAVLEDLT